MQTLLGFTPRAETAPPELYPTRVTFPVAFSTQPSAGTMSGEGETFGASLLAGKLSIAAFSPKTGSIQGNGLASLWRGSLGDLLDLH